MRKNFSLETSFKIGLLFAFLNLMWVSRSYPPEAKDFPMIVFSITTCLICMSLFQSFLRIKKTSKDHVGAKGPTALSNRHHKRTNQMDPLLSEHQSGAEHCTVLNVDIPRKRLLESIVMILASIGIGYLGGFLFTVPFFFVGFGFLHGKKGQNVRYVAIAAGVTGCIYVLFSGVMGVPLLQGFLWR